MLVIEITSAFMPIPQVGKHMNQTIKSPLPQITNDTIHNMVKTRYISLIESTLKQDNCQIPTNQMLVEIIQHALIVYIATI